MALPQAIRRQKLLLAEGKDELHFLDELLKIINISGVQIIDIGGKDKFRPSFPTITALSGFRSVVRLGIIRDAEANAAGTLASVQQSLKENGLTAPQHSGVVLTNAVPQIGIWIMPDNRRAGCIEDLCWDGISEADPRRGCAEMFMGCLGESLEKKAGPPGCSASAYYFPKQAAKAKLQAYLAGLHEPQRELGRAAQAGVWNLKHSAFTGLRNFLAELFQ